jgi:hypothetical protein
MRGGAQTDAQRCFIILKRFFSTIYAVNPCFCPITNEVDREIAVARYRIGGDTKA